MKLHQMGIFSWVTPTMVDPNVATIVLAFQKTYLDGDEIWMQYIKKSSTNVSTWKAEHVNNSIIIN